MATAKKVAAAKKAAAPAKKSTAPVAKKAPAAAKPIKEVMGKTALVAHIAQSTGLEPKAVKAVMGCLESTMLASVAKKGAGAFVLPGLLKISVVAVPAKKKRVGIDPFTKQERTFAAKPASVKMKVRTLKKLKDAAL